MNCKLFAIGLVLAAVAASTKATQAGWTPAGCGTSSSANYQNLVRAAQARAERRRLLASRRAAIRHEGSSRDETVAFNRSRTPKRLSPDQFDPQRGTLHWPTVLETTEFAELRGQLDHLFAERALHPYKTGQGALNRGEVEHLTREFRQRLQVRVHDLSANDFITADRFLKSLAYEARFESVAQPDATS
jgi:hypothetical protein